MAKKKPKYNSESKEAATNTQEQAGHESAETRDELPPNSPRLHTIDAHVKR